MDARKRRQDVAHARSAGRPIALSVSWNTDMPLASTIVRRLKKEAAASLPRSNRRK